MTDTELISVVTKLNNLLKKTNSKFENLIVIASSDKEKVTQEEFVNAMYKLDNKFKKSDLNAL